MMNDSSALEIYSESELLDLVEKLNLFFSEYGPWKVHRARKEHVDLFGSHIAEKILFQPSIWTGLERSNQNVFLLDGATYIFLTQRQSPLPGNCH